MFHIALFIAFLYLLWRLILPLPFSRLSKCLLGLFLLFISKYHWLQLWIWGNMFSPELPTWAVLILGGLFAGFVLLCLITLTSDLAYLLRRLILRQKDARFSTASRLAVMGISTALTVYGVHQAIKVPEVRHVDITIQNLPDALNGFKVAHLTDLHISHLFKQEWLSQVVERTNQTQADMIAISGDLIDGHVADRLPDIKAYADFKARYGVFTSLGNHEYYYNGKAWAATFRQMGMQVLENEHRRIEHNGQTLVIAGVNDTAAINFNLDGPDLDTALQGAPEAPIILLDHRPKNVQANIAKGVDLQLSGHTHGGMIIGFTEIVRAFNQGFVSGLYKVGNGWLYQSNGTGLWNGFPIRIGVPSEITLITLKKG
ncbi:MAG: metallophosphoesterase [Pelistega sp.]|nr:metallophosphoesterase [Pelistega sp.]